MLELTNSQLEHPDDVAPYRAFRDLLELLVQEERLPRPATFLDIGCGMGAYGELLERLAPGRFEYTGADYAEAVVARAQERWPSRRFVCRDVHEPARARRIRRRLRQRAPRRARRLRAGARVALRCRRAAGSPPPAADRPPLAGRGRPGLSRPAHVPLDADAGATARRSQHGTAAGSPRASTSRETCSPSCWPADRRADGLLDPEGVRRAPRRDPAQRRAELDGARRRRAGRPRRRRAGCRRGGSGARRRPRAGRRAQRAAVRLGSTTRSPGSTRSPSTRFAASSTPTCSSSTTCCRPSRWSRAAFERFLVVGETRDLDVRDGARPRTAPRAPSCARRALVEGTLARRDRDRLLRLHRPVSSTRCRRSSSVAPASTTGSSGARASVAPSSTRRAPSSPSTSATTTRTSRAGSRRPTSAARRCGTRSSPGAAARIYTIFDASHRLQRRRRRSPPRGLDASLARAGAQGRLEAREPLIGSLPPMPPDAPDRTFSCSTSTTGPASRRPPTCSRTSARRWRGITTSPSSPDGCRAATSCRRTRC